MNEFEEMYRAFGYNQEDQIVHYAAPRHSYEESGADLIEVMGIRDVFSASIEKRLVRAGSVTFVVDEDAPEVPEEVKPAK